MGLFHKGLNEAGYVDGNNVAIEYHWAEGAAKALGLDLQQRADEVIE
jgi:hypothetical protein